MTNMGNSTVGTPEYCNANFPSVRIFHSEYPFILCISDAMIVASVNLLLWL